MLLIGEEEGCDDFPDKQELDSLQDKYKIVIDLAEELSNEQSVDTLGAVDLIVLVDPTPFNEEASRHAPRLIGQHA